MQCTVCTFLNDSRLLECEVCQSSLNTSIIQGDIDIRNPIHPAKRARFDVVSRSTVPDAEPSFDSGAATQGIIPTLRNVLDRKRSKYAVCSPCPHITQKGFEGRQWACGYRNIQMLCLALVQRPEFKERLFNGSGDIPDIHGLQSWIEKAWAAGFDVQGCAELGGTLLGSDTWIGSTECAALLRFFGLRAHVVDFPNFDIPKPCSNERKTISSRTLDTYWSIDSVRRRPALDGEIAPTSSSSHSRDVPSSAQAAEEKEDHKIGARIDEWVRKYFAKFGKSNAWSFEQGVFIPPLYFQQQGHSRTIIGYEEMPSKTSLLVFDPACNGKALKENLLADNGAWQRQVKRGLHTLTRAAYSIVYVAPGHMTPEEQESSKIIRGRKDSEDIALHI